MERIIIGYLIIVIAVLLMLMVFMMLALDSYHDGFEEAQIYIEEWHNKCDSLLDKNCELHEKVYELQDSIITLKYKEY